MNERISKLYEEAFGREALERQKALAKTLHPCCGEHRDGPHHEACAKWVEPTPTVHADQIGLL